MEEAAVLALIIIIVGAVLILIEALNPGAFVIIPGTVLVIVGAIGYAVPDFLISIYSPIVAVALALPVTLITIKLYQGQIGLILLGFFVALLT